MHPKAQASQWQAAQAAWPQHPPPGTAVLCSLGVSTGHVEPEDEASTIEAHGNVSQAKDGGP